MPQTVDLDISDLVCPRTVAVVRRCLTELEVGDRLRVVGDDPAVARSIRRTCATHGFEVSAERDTATTFVLRIRVTEEATLDAG